MISSRAVFAPLLLLVSGQAWAAGNIPGDLPAGAAPELTARVFFKHEPWMFYTELQGAWETDSRAERSVLVGGYYRLLDNLKTGVFYQGAEGIRHDEDWGKTNGTWQWQDTSSRFESLLVLDASPRMELHWLPGTNWLGEFKTRFYYNFFDSDETLTLRPGLAYFWMPEGRPFIHFFLQCELAFPLNYGAKPINGAWAYLGALYHLPGLRDSIELGGYVAQAVEYWSSTTAFTALTGTTYTVQGDSTLLGLVAVIELGGLGI